jgi:ABC-type branched-subunit amino acid transport system substrate-binding protein
MHHPHRHVFVVSLTALVACTQEGPPAGQFRIPLGALTDITGGTGSTTLYKAAAELAARQMNEGLQLAGSEIRFDLKVLDSRGDPLTSQVAALTLINQHQVVGLVADLSGVSAAVNQLNYDPGKGAHRPVPVACYSCSSSYFNDPTYVDSDSTLQAAHRDPDNWLYRVFYNGKSETLLEGRIALAKGAASNGDVNGDGRFKLGIYAQNDSFGRSSAAAITAAIAGYAPALPWSTEVVEVDYRVDINSYDWSTDLGRFFDDEAADGSPDVAADVVFLALLPNPAMAAVKSYRESAFAAPLMSTSSFRRTYILRNLGTSANGVEGNSSLLHADDDSGHLFFEAMMAANKEPPEQLCANTYDSVATLMLAALIGGLPLERPDQVTPAAVRDAMVRLFDPAGETIRPTPADFARAVTSLQQGLPIHYRGASGVSFDDAGENFPRLVHWRVEGGRFQDLEAYDCSPQTPGGCARVP